MKRKRQSVELELPENPERTTEVGMISKESFTMKKFGGCDEINVIDCPS